MFKNHNFHHHHNFLLNEEKSFYLNSLRVFKAIGWPKAKSRKLLHMFNLNVIC